MGNFTKHEFRVNKNGQLGRSNDNSVWSYLKDTKHYNDVFNIQWTLICLLHFGSPVFSSPRFCIGLVCPWNTTPHHTCCSIGICSGSILTLRPMLWSNDIGKNQNFELSAIEKRWLLEGVGSDES